MKIFITGISGLLGLNLALQAQKQFAVSGCYFSHPVYMSGVAALPVDMTRTSDLEAAIHGIRPDLIVHTAGLTSVDGCEGDPDLAIAMNTTAAKNVAAIAASLDARLVHISTDHLFDGTEPWKTETSATGPLNVYARSKLMAEQAVLEANPKALVVRTNFYGWGTSVRASFSDWILQGLKQNKDLTMFTDVFFTPILANHLGQAIFDLANSGATGVVNLAGGERISKHGFALELAKEFGYSGDNIRPISVDEFQLKAQRPKEMSLCADKAEGILNRKMPSVAEGLAELKSLQQQGWREALEKSLKVRPTQQKSA